MDSLRKPFLLAAAVCMFLVVGIELGSLGFLSNADSGGEFAELSSPGLGIPYLALFDLILCYALFMMCLALIVQPSTMGKLQGIIAFFYFLILLIAALILIFVAVGMLLLMISLIMAVPFGFLAYLGAFADFEVGSANATLGVILLLKYLSAVLLVLAQQRFLTMKGLILLVVVSIVMNLIVAFLQGFPPGIFASVTDAIAAIVVAVVALVWAALSFIGSIPAVIKALRVDKALTG
ncbi:MAG: hypothetical protein AAF513_00915 [Pseudomonadota bacterium]